MPKSQPATDAVRDQRGPDDASGLGRIIYLAPRRPLRTIAASAETRRDNVAASCWLTEGDWCAMDRRTQRKTQWTRSILCLIPVLALVLLALVLVSGMVMHLHQRRAAIVRLQDRGVDVGTESPESSCLDRFAWVRALREKYLFSVTDIEASDASPPFTDDDLAGLRRWRDLSILSLDGAEITDNGLQRLRGMRGLTLLDLSSTQITDAGLEHLGPMTNLWFLSLYGTRVTDDGLRHLACPGVIELDLSCTRVTDVGLAQLGRLMPQLRDLYLEQTRITDRGLSAMAGMRSLRKVVLTDAKCTDEGISQLRKALPRCRVLALVPGK